jgi:hypothetical protein
MQLVTKELRKQLPALGATEKQADPQVLLKLFTPDSSWTWYVTEFDGKDSFFGLVVGFEIELGYFSLSELEATTGPLGLHVERDLYFKPTPLSEVRKKHGRH